MRLGRGSRGLGRGWLAAGTGSSGRHGDGVSAGSVHVEKGGGGITDERVTVLIEGADEGFDLGGSSAFMTYICMKHFCNSKTVLEMMPFDS